MKISSVPKQTMKSNQRLETSAQDKRDSFGYSFFSFLDSFVFILSFLQPVETELQNGCRKTRNHLVTLQKRLTTVANRLTCNFQVDFPIDSTFGPIESDSDIQQKIKLIIFVRQCERIVIDLMDELSDVQQSIGILLKQFRTCLNRIHAIVKFRIAVLIEHIFVSQT